MTNIGRKRDAGGRPAARRETKADPPPEWKQEIRGRLTPLNLAPARESEIVEELAQHLEDRYAELLSGGAAPEEASRAALAELSETQCLSVNCGALSAGFRKNPSRSGTIGGRIWSQTCGKICASAREC